MPPALLRAPAVEDHGQALRSRAEACTATSVANDLAREVSLLAPPVSQAGPTGIAPAAARTIG
ncbi:hypothetical protein BN9982_1680005 [Mycobacterium tuberculosis]|nr:hypothetical protein BN9982_1680005 [Mycobacterium tuberculosis]